MFDRDCRTVGVTRPERLYRKLRRRSAVRIFLSNNAIMLIIIPSTKYTATVQGHVEKFVLCERCTYIYTYTMHRIASGTHSTIFSSSSGPDKAAEKAWANLNHVLENDHDNVPCPRCQWHQSAHIAAVRSRSYEQLKNLAGAFFIFAGIIFALFTTVQVLMCLTLREPPTLNFILYCALAIFIVASPGLLLRGLRSLILLKYNPNSRL